MDSRDLFGAASHGRSQLIGFEDLDELTEPEDPQYQVFPQWYRPEEVEVTA